MPPRFRFRQRADGTPRDRQYDVARQDAPRQRWQDLGWVMGLSGETGPPAWAGLANGADAWTEWRTTRQAAADDMAAGRTFTTAVDVRAAEAAAAAAQRMQDEVAADQAQYREEHENLFAADTDREAG
jgi:hypothetical protein